MSATFRGTFVSVVTQDITAFLPTSAFTLEGFVVMPEVLFSCDTLQQRFTSCRKFHVFINLTHLANRDLCMI